MTDLFIRILNMSISAGWLVLAVVILRPFLKKAPRWILPLLWGIVGIRLVIPVTVESVFSLIPSAETISPEIVHAPAPTIHSGVSVLNSLVNPVLGDTFGQTVENTVPPLQSWLPVLAWVWICGMVLMLLYMIGSTALLSHRMASAVLYRENVYLNERVGSPFVLGFFRPRIYMPFALQERDMEYGIAHEKAHIRRRDHWIKPVGFVLLSVHWFHPLVWLAYVLLCRDIEMACDERVIRDLGDAQRADYSEALLTCSIGSRGIGRRTIAACPVAFGEVSVKTRVKNVLHYRKPAVWIVAAALFVCVSVALCFLTNPPEEEQDLSFLNYKTAVSQAGQQTELFAVHFYPTEDTENSGIGIGGVSGRELAAYLENRHWTECREPDGKLYSPGSVQFSLADDYRITVYDRRGMFAYASVKFQEEERFYRADWKDYGEAVAILHRFRQPLTLNKVIELSEKGEELTWADFGDFAYVETGSGLYIRHYPIDERFSLRIGGPNPDEEPWYIYLEVANGYESRIDIRRDYVEGFIAEHSKDTIIADCSFGWQRCAVGYSAALEERMKDLSEGDVIGSGGTMYPAVRVDSEKELAAFLEEVQPLFTGLLYPEESSLEEILTVYDAQYFEENALFLLYCPAENTAVRHELEVAWVEKAHLELGVRLADPALGDSLPEDSYMAEGWLMTVGIPREQLASVKTFHARHVSSYDPTYVPPAVTEMYVLTREQKQFSNTDGSVTMFMNPSVTLYADGTYQFFFSPISSHIGIGTFTKTKDRLTLTEKNSREQYVFTVTETGLVFDGESSSERLWFSELQDGETFAKGMMPVLADNTEVP